MTKGRRFIVEKDDDDNDNFKIIIILCTFEISAHDNIKTPVYSRNFVWF
jgi:hypothetical protein